MTEQAIKSQRHLNRLRVEVGDLFVPKELGPWNTTSYLVVRISCKRPIVVHLGGQRSGEVLALDVIYLQRSYWTTNFNRF